MFPLTCLSLDSVSQSVCVCVCVYSIRLSSHQRIFLCPSTTSLVRLSSRFTPTAAAFRSPNLAPGRRAMPLY